MNLSQGIRYQKDIVYDGQPELIFNTKLLPEEI